MGERRENGSGKEEEGGGERVNGSSRKIVQEIENVMGVRDRKNI